MLNDEVISASIVQLSGYGKKRWPVSQKAFMEGVEEGIKFAFQVKPPQGCTGPGAADAVAPRVPAPPLISKLPVEEAVSPAPPPVVLLGQGEYAESYTPDAKPPRKRKEK